MKKFTALLVIAITLSGCQVILKKMYGIKDPGIENEKTITKKALKYDLDTSNLATINQADYLLAMQGQSIPDCAVFDSKGEYIEYRQSDTSCNAGLFGFIPELSKGGLYNKTGKTTLSNELAKLRTLKGQPFPEPPPADFYLLIYWTVFAGKLNKDHVKVWEDLARENKNCRIHVIKVNADQQKYWEEPAITGK